MKSRLFVITSILVPLAIAWAVMYLICAFVSVSFDIANWSEQARLVCAIWGTAFGAGLWYRLEKYDDVV